MVCNSFDAYLNALALIETAIFTISISDCNILETYSNEYPCLTAFFTISLSACNSFDAYLNALTLIETAISTIYLSACNFIDANCNE